MKKVFRWTRKWFFMIVLVLTGSIYFVSTESGLVYAKPLARVEEWLSALTNSVVGSEYEQNIVAVGDSLETFESAAEGSGVEEDTEEKVLVEVPSVQATLTPAEPAQTVPPEASPKPEEVVYVNVEDDYFSDAVFIGDSRTVGLYEYGGLEETAAFYASTGLTIYKMFESPIVQVSGQKAKLTIEEALQENQFGKIYLMIGINEMGTGTVETFIETYGEAVEHLQELQPDAIIYLQGIMKVTTERSEQGDYIHNEGIEARNKEIAKLADNERIFYLDVNPLICDENGGMEASYTYDGVHLKAQYTSIWKDYLKTKAVKVASEN